MQLTKLKAYFIKTPSLEVSVNTQMADFELRVPDPKKSSTNHCNINGLSAQRNISLFDSLFFLTD